MGDGGGKDERRHEMMHTLLLAGGVHGLVVNDDGVEETLTANLSNVLALHVNKSLEQLTSVQSVVGEYLT